ncbi:hypothetical protein ACFE04_004058 [Oxalis oulophora]
MISRCSFLLHSSSIIQYIIAYHHETNVAKFTGVKLNEKRRTRRDLDSRGSISFVRRVVYATCTTYFTSITQTTAIIRFQHLSEVDSWLISSDPLAFSILEGVDSSPEDTFLHRSSEDSIEIFEHEKLQCVLHKFKDSQLMRFYLGENEKPSAVSMFVSSCFSFMTSDDNISYDII